MNDIKVVLFTCDKCHKEDTLVAYNHKWGWYCKDCLAKIRDGLNETIAKIDMCATQINNTLGVDIKNPEK